MEPTLNDSIFDEAFKIITTNKSKANSLRQLLLKDNNNDNDLNLQVIEYLGEFEYDLKTLFDILRDLKLSFHDIRNTLNNSIKEKDINKDISIKEQNDLDNNKKERERERLYLNDDAEIFETTPNVIKKTYSMTSKKIRNLGNNSKINEYYIHSYPRKKFKCNKYNDNDNRLPRSLSCKSYIGNWNSKPSRLELIDINNNRTINNYNSITNRKENEYKSIFDNNKYKNNNRLYNDKDAMNKYYDSYFSNDNLSSNRTIKLNFDYDTYATDYSLHKTNRKKELNNSNVDNVNNSKLNLNLDLADINNKNDINNNLYYNPNNNNINENINIDNIITNENVKEDGNNLNLNDNKNNLFTFTEHKNNDYNVTFNPKKNIIANNNNNNFNVDENRNENDINENYNNNIYNYKRNDTEDIINNNNNNNNEYIPYNKNNKYNNLNKKYIFHDDQDVNNNENKENDPMYQNNNNNNKFNDDYYNFIRQKYPLNVIYSNNNNNSKTKKYLFNPELNKSNKYYMNDSNLNNNINNNVNNDINNDNMDDNNTNNNMDNEVNINTNNNNMDNEVNINTNNNNGREEYDDELEQQKKSIIKNIMSEIFQDTNKLDLLKRELGDDIGEKLLSGNISEESLYKIASILKNYQLNQNNKKKKQKQQKDLEPNVEYVDLEKL